MRRSKAGAAAWLVLGLAGTAAVVTFLAGTVERRQMMKSSIPQRFQRFPVAVPWRKEEKETTTATVAAKEQDPTHAPIPVTIYDEAKYNGTVARTKPVDEKLCKRVTTLKPPFQICVHDASYDKWVSGSYLKGGTWEAPTTSLIIKHLKAYKSTDAVFVDCGVNVGSHALYVATSGYRTWGVDPLPTNLVKVYHAARMSGTLGTLRLVHNAIDKERGEISVEVTAGNIGGSHVIDPASTSDVAKNSVEHVGSVLLADIFEDVARVTGATSANPATAFLKLDIERHECRAVVGSRELFRDPRFVIPHILMEHHFEKEYPSCPYGMLKDMVYTLAAAGYVPYDKGHKMVELDLTKHRSWPPTDVLWTLEGSRP